MSNLTFPHLLTIAVIVCFCLFCDVDCTDQHNKRSRVYAGDLEITLTELDELCCENNYKCCAKLSGLTEQIDNCTEEEHVSKNFTVNSQGPACPYDKDDKKLARTTFCESLGLIDRVIRLEVIPNLKACEKHVTFESDQKPPSRIISSLQRWHEDMVELHTTKNCCFKADTTTIPTINIRNTRECDDKWDDNITKAFNHILVAETLRTFGRHAGKPKVCLRGCVGMPSIECALTPIDVKNKNKN